jgi:hypothetical protein
VSSFSVNERPSWVFSPRVSKTVAGHRGRCDIDQFGGLLYGIGCSNNAPISRNTATFDAMPTASATIVVRLNTEHFLAFVGRSAAHS